MAKLNNLMAIERILLEIETKHKFSINFNDAYKLHNYLKKVGSITSYAFLIQDEFSKKFNDVETLKEYHKKLMDCNIDFPLELEDNITRFIDRINEQLKNEELNNLILNISWW